MTAWEALLSFCALIGATSLIVLIAMVLFAIADTLADRRDQRRVEASLARDARELDYVPADWSTR